MLFLKIAQENNSDSLLPSGYRWTDLANRNVDGLLGFYQEMLTHLGATADNAVVRAVYAFPTTVFSHSENLKAVIDGISKLQWHEVGHDRFGQIYSGLIDKSAQDVRSGAGQYFTPRSLIDSIIRIIQPTLGELIQDPAAGSGGFLVSADRYIRIHHPLDEYIDNPPRYQGVEIEKNTRRICLMNTFLHGLNAEIIYGDALTDDAISLEPADLIVANPPFGSRAGSKRTLRGDLSYPRSNKQLAFLQHIYSGLKEGGRAAVILPDNVLFEDGVGKEIRFELMETCNLHTILRLPTGIFSSTGIKTNVLFFTRARHSSNATQQIWFYDIRANMPHFGKTVPLLPEHFTEFEQRFGDNPCGTDTRQEEGESGRFRCFSREDIAARDWKLDFSWLRDDDPTEEEGTNEPKDLAAAMLQHLRAAMTEVESVVDELTDSSELQP